MGKMSNFGKSIKSMWSTPATGRFLNIKEMGVFGMYALGNSFISSAANNVLGIIFIPYFYHINSVHAYIIMFASCIINLIAQPLIGTLMERTNTKFGKYKPYILFSLPLFSFFTIMTTWIPQFSIESSRILYAYLVCVPLNVLMQFTSNMYNTMPNIITPNPQERADLMTPIGLIVGLAPSILQIIAGPIRAVFAKQGKEYLGLRIMGLISVVVGSILVLMILKVKERVFVIEDSNKEKIGFGKSMKMIFKNKPLFILFIALTLGSLREFNNTFTNIIIQTRYSTNVETALNMSGLITTILGFASTVGMILLPILTRKFSKHTIIIGFSTLNMVVFAFLALFGFQNIPIGTASSVVLTILFFIVRLSPTYLIIPLMIGELADNQQYITDKRLEGHIQNFIFTVPLLLSQVFMLVTLVFQNLVGFEPKDYQGILVYSEAQQLIATKWYNVTAIISAVSCLLLVIVLLFYPLSKKKHAQIVKELQEKATLTDI